MPKHSKNAMKPKNMKKTLKQLALYCKRYLGIVVLAIIFSTGAAVLAVLCPNLLSDLSDEILVKLYGLSIDMSAVVKICITLMCMFFANLTLHYFQSFIMNTVACRISLRMRGEISKKINILPLKYFDTHNYGDTLSRVTNDVDTVVQASVSSVSSLTNAIAMLVGSVVMMFVTQWLMAITAIVATIIGFVLMALVMSKSQKYFNARQKNLAEVNGHVEEYFAGQNVVRVYNAEKQAHDDFDGKNKKLKRATFKAEFLGGIMMPMMMFVGNLGYVAVCVVGAALAFKGTISFSVVVAFIIYVRLFTNPLSQIAQGMANMQAAASAGERVFEFLGEDELVDESGKQKRIDTVKGDVVFNHVKFGYNEDRTIIKDFNLPISAGQKVAIVGPTGAGKTTLVNLLMRFYELNGGSITVDGVPLSEITRENVHELFGMVLQDTWLFAGTLRENLSFGKADVTDEELNKVCADVGLGHFVKTLPQGLDTRLDETVTISAGQKQLITIARAMIENAPMLILDEATSSVDTRTEIQIQRAMEKLTEGRTSFVIAHRLSTIRDSDCIIVLNEGDVMESGNHEELMKKKGFYYNLYNSQFAAA